MHGKTVPKCPLCFPAEDEPSLAFNPGFSGGFFPIRDGTISRYVPGRIVGDWQGTDVYFGTEGPDGVKGPGIVLKPAHHVSVKVKMDLVVDTPQANGIIRGIGPTERDGT